MDFAPKRPFGPSELAKFVAILAALGAVSLIFCARRVHAQERNSYVSLDLTAPKLAFSAVSTENETQSIDYNPDTPLVAGLNLSLSGFRLGVSAAIGGLQGSRNTDYRDFDFAYNFDAVGFDFAYASYTGFTAKRHSDLAAEASELQREMQVSDINTNAYFLPWSRGLSLKNFFDSAARLTESGFGVLGILFYERMGMANGAQDIVPSDYQSGLGTDAGIRRPLFSSVGLEAGPIGTFVVSHFFLSGTYAYGVSKNAVDYVVDDSWYSHSETSTRGLLSVHAGYSDDDFFTTLSYFDQKPRYRLRSMTVDVARTELRLSVGKRF